MEDIRTPPLSAAFHEAFPDKLILSSETASDSQHSGHVHFPKWQMSIVRLSTRPPGVNSTSKQVSAYDLYTANFGSSPADKVFAAQDSNPFAAGEFVWTGWDYIGEPTPYYSARSSYCGIIDLAGFKKDRFYLYQARWRPGLRMAHILPHWSWPERVGQLTPVHVFTAADEAELFLDGKSQGCKTREEHSYRFRWDEVKYQPGELRVITYKDGSKWGGQKIPCE
ncbi:hypothetical protein AJ80_08873 [Polytolypa hystricis UAMH7299]|uniref:DUF4982 domain-containing protein n=1 Tax=Polytolypa hystricis (strain UAMH7299) TaxID=1447883 RepID=A0A2B7X0N9_POLH7|nr:hypothetical protein AJ80_08873 [Polytolypa hystricis UAMH7299]